MNGQDYAWVKQGMVFPFAEFMDRCVWLHGTCYSCFCWITGDLISKFFYFFIYVFYFFIFLSLFRFQGQTQLFKSKPSDFRKALEEAKLAEDGILESQLRAEEMTDVEAHPDKHQQVSASNIDREYYCQDKVIFYFFLLLCVLH